MCWECIKRTCCNIVEIESSELDKIRHLNPITQKFLVKRKSIIGCLNNMTMIGIVFYIILMIIVIAGVSLNSNGVIIDIGIVAMIILTIILCYLITKYYFIKKWYESWYDYKNSMYYSKIIALTYVIQPIIGLLNYTNGNNGAALNNMVNLIAIFPAIVSVIHVFILKSNNLTKEINTSYEYRIISLILKVIYIPIVIPILGIAIALVGNIWFTLFAVTYVLLITVSLIINNQINEKIEDILAMICFVLIGIMGFAYDIAIISKMLIIYIDYVTTSVVITDLTNDWIMKNRDHIQDFEGNIGIIARDNGYNNTELTQLRINDIQSDNKVVQDV